MSYRVTFAKNHRSTYVAPRKLNDDDEDMVARFGEYVGGRKKGRSGGEAKKKRRS